MPHTRWLDAAPRMGIKPTEPGERKRYRPAVRRAGRPSSPRSIATIPSTVPTTFTARASPNLRAKAGCSRKPRTTLRLNLYDESHIQQTASLDRIRFTLRRL